MSDDPHHSETVMNERAPDVSRSPSRLDAIARDAEPLAQAVALGELAATIGFDWASARDALDKVREEAEELAEALEAGEREAICAELGDLLFSVCMVARMASVDPGEALQMTHAKFRRRFAYIEQELERRELSVESTLLPVLEAIWAAAKRSERA